MGGIGEGGRIQSIFPLTTLINLVLLMECKVVLLADFSLAIFTDVLLASIMIYYLYRRRTSVSRYVTIPDPNEARVRTLLTTSPVLQGLLMGLFYTL